MCHFSFLEKQSVSRIYVLWLCAKDVLPHYTQQNILNTGKKLLSDPIVNFRSFSRKMTTALRPPSTRCFLLPNKYMLEIKSLRLLFLEGGPRLVYTSPQQPLTFCAPLPQCGNKYEKERLDFMKRVILLHRGGEMRISPLGELLHKIKDCRECLKWDLDLVSILFPDFSPEEVKQIPPWTTTD